MVPLVLNVPLQVAKVHSGEWGWETKVSGHSMGMLCPLLHPEPMVTPGEGAGGRGVSCAPERRKASESQRSAGREGKVDRENPGEASCAMRQGVGTPETATQN